MVSSPQHRSGVGQHPLFDADQLVAGVDLQAGGHLFPRAQGGNLDPVCVGVAAKAADQVVVFQLLVQPAAQVEHSPVDHGADTPHPFDVAGPLHFAQSVPDHRPADPHFGGQIHLGGQMVGVGVAAVPQLVQQVGDDPVADHDAAQAAGVSKSGFFHAVKFLSLSG